MGLAFRSICTEPDLWKEAPPPSKPHNGELKCDTTQKDSSLTELNRIEIIKIALRQTPYNCNNNHYENSD